MFIDESEAGAILRGVYASPKDLSARFGFADWLLENGFHEWAAFVQWQLADPRRYAKRNGNAYPIGVEVDDAWKSARDVNGPHGISTGVAGWFAGHAKEVTKAWGDWIGTNEWVWRNGFVEELNGLTSTEWLDHCDALVAAFPLRKVMLRSRLTMQNPRVRYPDVNYRPQVAMLAGSEGFGQTRKKRATGYIMVLPEGGPGSATTDTNQLPTALLDDVIHKEWPNTEIVMPPVGRGQL